MGRDTTPSSVRGWLIPDSRISNARLSSTSTYTEQGPEPGLAEAATGNDGSLELRTHGVATSTTAIDVRAASGGYPGRRHTDLGIHWRVDGATDWIGWDPPYVRGWETVAIRADGGTQEDLHPAVLALRHPDRAGALILATSRRAGSAYRIDVRLRAAADTSWSALATVATDGLNQHNYPVLIELPSGRVVLYYWVVAGSRYQIRALSSDDGGTTWATYSPWCLAEPLDIGSDDPYTLAAAYSAGEVLLIASSDEWVSAGGMSGAQYASGDDGQAFDLVLDHSTVASAIWYGFTVAPDATGFVIVWWQIAAGTYTTHAQRLGSAYQPMDVDLSKGVFGAASGSDFPVYTLLDGRTAAWRDDDGAVYVLATWGDGATARRVRIAKSEDGGSTWLGADGVAMALPADARLIWQDNTEFWPRDYAAACFGGRVVLATGWGGGGYDDDSLATLWLGGYSTNPIRSNAAAEIAAEWPQYVWGAGISPTSLAHWTTTTAGVPTEVLDDAGLEITSGAGASRIWSRNLTAGSDYIRATWRVATTSGSSTAARRQYVRVSVSDGAASEYVAEVWIAATGLAVRDAVAGTTLTTESGWTLGGLLRVEVTSAGEVVVSILKDLLGSDRMSQQVRRWTQLYTGALTQKTVGVAATSYLEWGTDSGTATVARWRWMEYVESQTAYDLPIATADKIPRRLTAEPLDLESGLQVSAIDGPAARGDLWDIGVRARFPIELIDPRVYPSPRQAWRSVGDAAQALIRWDLDDADSTFGPCFGVFLDGLNWRLGRIQGWDGATWTTLIEIDTAADATGLSYLRRGDTLEVDPAGAGRAARWWALHELAGATAELDATIRRRIETSSSGWWGPDTGVRPTIRMRAVNPADPASGSALRIWRRTWCGVVQSTSRFRAIRLVIDAQNTVDDDLRVGVVAIGRVLVTADPDWGRAIETTPQASLITTRSGSRIGRRLGAERRLVEVSWPTGVEQGPVSGRLSASPDWYAGPAGPVASPHATPTDLEGMLRSLDGPVVPLVYLPSIDLSQPTQAIMGRERLVYGRLTSATRREAVAGTEDRDEWQRHLQMVLEEEL